MKDKKIEKYFKNLKHPEIEFYGLNCDIQLWAKFNKELRLREIIDKRRTILSNMMQLLDEPESFSHNGIYTDEERLYALAKLGLLIQQDKIDKFNYEVKDENYITSINSNNL